MIDIPSKVAAKDVIENGEFPGIWCYGGVPTRCWVDSETMILNSVSGHIWGALLVDIGKKTVQKLSDLGVGVGVDLKVLDVDMKAKKMLFMTSSIQRGHTVDVYNLSTKSMHTLMSTIDGNLCENELIASISKIETKVIALSTKQEEEDEDDDNESKEEEDENSMYESILYLPPPGMTSFDSDPVLMLYVHGGPHSVSTNTFSHSMLTLIYSGFAVLQVLSLCFVIEIKNKIK